MFKKLLCMLAIPLFLSSSPSFGEMPKSDEASQLNYRHGRFYRVVHRGHRHHRRYHRVMYYYNRGEEHHGITLPVPKVHRAGDNDED